MYRLANMPSRPSHVRDDQQGPAPAAATRAIPIFPRMQWLHVRLFAIVSLLLIMMGTSHAAVFCVRNSSELAAAAMQIPASPGNNVIYMAAGTYSLSSPFTINAAGFVTPGDLTILGGYNSDCSARSMDPNATVIQGTSASAAFQVNSRINSITLDGLTLRQLGAVFGHLDGGVYESVPPRLGQLVTLRRIRATQANLIFQINSHDARVENLLMVGGENLSFSRTYGDTRGVPNVDVVNATVTDAQLKMTCIQVISGTPPCPFAGANLRVYNSIFTRPGNDIELGSAWLVSHHNMLSGVSTVGGGAIISQVANLSTAALLDANYRPGGGSPAIDSGTASVSGNLPGIDHGGGPRIIGATVDRGALESAFSTGNIHTVTTINDSGAGSLRQAITNAGINGGHQFIRFNIPGQCPRRIVLQSPLPSINHSLMIDGHSQPGTTLNTSETGWNADPCVLISGNNTLALGLTTNLDSRLRVYGLAFEGFTSGAISILGGDEHVIEGNQFGGTIFNALDLMPNGVHVSVGAGGRRARIGGPLPSQRNLLSGATNAAVSLSLGANDNAIVNNLIGMRRNLSQADPNQHGIVINRASNNEISGNRIYGNTLDGIRILGTEADGNLIRDNRFSIPRLLIAPLTNGRHAIHVLNDARNTEIGPGNVIANTTQAAIRIAEGRGHHVWGNRISAWANALTLDIGEEGANPILNGAGYGLACSGMANANCRRNPPELIDIGMDTSDASAPKLNVEFRLRAPTGQHRVEFYASTACQVDTHSGSGPGERPLGAVDVTVFNPPLPNPATAPWVPHIYQFTLPLEPGQLPSFDDKITAIVTDGSGNSSEFSQCNTLWDDTPTGDLIFADGFENVVPG